MINIYMFPNLLRLGKFRLELCSSIYSIKKSHPKNFINNQYKISFDNKHSIQEQIITVSENQLLKFFLNLKNYDYKPYCQNLAKVIIN